MRKGKKLYAAIAKVCECIREALWNVFNIYGVGEIKEFCREASECVRVEGKLS